jgi:hypothetical protein
MRKTREERKALLDRIEKKYKEKLLLQNFKNESQRLSQQLAATRGMRVDQLHQEDVDGLELSGYRPTYS